MGGNANKGFRQPFTHKENAFQRIRKIMCRRGKESNGQEPFPIIWDIQWQKKIGTLAPEVFGWTQLYFSRFTRGGRGAGSLGAAGWKECWLGAGGRGPLEVFHHYPMIGAQKAYMSLEHGWKHTQGRGGGHLQGPSANCITGVGRGLGIVPHRELAPLSPHQTNLFE